MLIKGDIYDGMDRRNMANVLRNQGWTTDEARGVWTIDERANIFTDITKGVQRLDQIKGSITIGFVDSMESGPLAGEPVRWTGAGKRRTGNRAWFCRAMITPFSSPIFAASARHDLTKFHLSRIVAYGYCL
jgi:hypothetical protein